MSERPDDPVDDEEALSWAGDEELGRAVPRRSRSRRADAFDPDPSTTDELESAIERADDELDGPDEANAAARPGRSAATLLFGALYLVITVGWILSVQYTSSGSTSLIVELPWQFGEFMAMVSAPLVFLTVRELFLQRSTRAAVLGWAIGAVLVVPWPILVLLSRGVA